MKKQYAVLYALLLAGFLVGAVMFLYPILMRYQLLAENTGTIQRFQAVANEERVRISEGTKGGELDLLALLRHRMQAYNKRIYDEGQAGLSDPFAYEQTSFDLTDYGLEDSVAGYLSIPAMDLELPIYLGATQKNLAKGTAQLTETSLPLGGENTNCVLAGHRGMARSDMFRNILNIEVGDEITITNLWETLTYQAVEMKVVEPSEMDQVLIQEGKDMVTLLTCHPYPQNNQRYLVYCERVDEEA